MKRRGRPPHPDILTPRQWQVLALVRAGLTDREIALRLGISLDGAKFHVSEILGKLGVESRFEAVRWADQRQAAPTACLGRRRRPRRAQLYSRRLIRPARRLRPVGTPRFTSRERARGPGPHLRREAIAC